MANLKKIYAEIFGDDAERRTHIEANAKTSASMFQPRLESGPQNEVGDMAFSRNVIPPVIYDYITRFYPDLSPEQALGRMATKQNEALATKREIIRNAAVDAGLKKDKAAFEAWKKKREAFKKNIAPTVRGITLDWTKHAVPGFDGATYDFSKLLNREFGEIGDTNSHDALIRDIITKFNGRNEDVPVLQNKKWLRVMVTYAPRRS